MSSKANSIPRQESLIEPVVVNPFQHKLNLTFLDKIQIAVMSVTVAPIRLLLMVLLLLLVWPFARLSVAGRSEKDKEKPLTGWRTLLRPIVLLLCRGVFIAGGFFWVKTKGQQASAKDAPVLLLVPHSSFLDALPVVSVGLSSVVAKAATQKIAIFGSLIEFSQPVFVKREDPNSRVNTIKEIQRRGRSGGKWPQITIFPEGTCTNRTAVISFKQGAFCPGVPVQPVCIRYPNRTDTATWTWEGPGALSQLWLTLCQFYNRIELEYLPVYNPSDAEKSDPKLFANNVRKVMADALKLPMTEHTYDDCRLMTKAQKLAMPAHAGLVEFDKLHQKLGINLDQVQTFLERFKEIKTGKLKKSVSISFDEFSTYLMLPQSEALRDVFDLYDRNASGTIDFREYVIGLSLISEPVNNAETIELAFHLFDSDNKGYITPKELFTILSSAFNMPESDSLQLFKEVDQNQDDKITLDEFTAYAQKKPEYARIFVTYQELKKLHSQKNDRFGSDFEQWNVQRIRKSITSVNITTPEGSPTTRSMPEKQEWSLW